MTWDIQVKCNNLNTTIRCQIVSYIYVHQAISAYFVMLLLCTLTAPVNDTYIFYSDDEPNQINMIRVEGNDFVTLHPDAMRFFGCAVSIVFYIYWKMITSHGSSRPVYRYPENNMKFFITERRNAQRNE